MKAHHTKDPAAAPGSSRCSDAGGDGSDSGASGDIAASAGNEQQPPPQQQQRRQDPSQQSNKPAAAAAPQQQQPEEAALLSKTQQKKLRKRRLAAERKRQRQLGARDARRRKAEREGRDWRAEAARQRAVTAAGTSPWRRRRQLAWETETLPLARQSFQICVDCAFDDRLTAREIASLAKQLRYCHAANRAAPHPCLWAATGLLGGDGGGDDPPQAGSTTTTLQELQRQDPGSAEWSRRGFTGTAQSLEEYHRDDLPNVVYLTSDADRVLETLDCRRIYVIGGMVDRNRLRGAAWQRARQLGVPTARLPLDEHLAEALPTTRVLACNHVFALLLECRQQRGDWAAALRAVLPRRKRAAFQPQQQQQQQQEQQKSLQAEQQPPQPQAEPNQSSKEQPNSKPEQPKKQQSQSTEQEPLKEESQFKEQPSSAATPPPQPHNRGDAPSPPPQEDDWGLPMDFHVFARHQPHPVHFDRRRKFDILCVEALTPVDMAHLGSGAHDATGHCVWTGACWLVAAAAALSPPCFAHRRVLELGCGTGIGGLALLLSPQPQQQAAFVALTDSDPEALALCRRNCHLNHVSFDRYAVFPLTWGQEPLPKEVTDGKQPFETVLATDVLYDIGLLAPLFQTAAACLSAPTNTSSSSCYFVLAHVPRACYNTAHPPVDNLEEHIVERARTFGFGLDRLVRPRDLLLLQTTTSSSQPERDFPRDALNRMSLQEMQEIGAAIFVFERTATS